MGTGEDHGIIQHGGSVHILPKGTCIRVLRHKRLQILHCPSRGISHHGCLADHRCNAETGNDAVKLSVHLIRIKHVSQIVVHVQLFVLLDQLADIGEKSLCNVGLNRHIVGIQNQNVRHLSRCNIVVKLGISRRIVIHGGIAGIILYRDSVKLAFLVESNHTPAQVVIQIIACQRQHFLIGNVRRIHMVQNRQLRHIGIGIIVGGNDFVLSRLYEVTHAVGGDVGVDVAENGGHIRIAQIIAEHTHAVCQDQIITLSALDTVIVQEIGQLLLSHISSGCKVYLFQGQLRVGIIDTDQIDRAVLPHKGSLCPSAGGI